MHKSAQWRHLMLMWVGVLIGLVGAINVTRLAIHGQYSTAALYLLVPAAGLFLWYVGKTSRADAKHRDQSEN